MTGTTRCVQAARGYLARLVVVIGVLAALVLAHGVQCHDGMAPTMAIEHVATSSMAVDAVQNCAAPAAMERVDAHSPVDLIPAHPTHRLTAACGVPGAAAVSALAGNDSPDLPGQGGVLVACLAFIVVVVAVIVGLRPRWPRTFVPVLMSGRATVIRTVHPRTPSLAELCLLRT